MHRCIPPHLLPWETNVKYNTPIHGMRADHSLLLELSEKRNNVWFLSCCSVKQWDCGDIWSSVPRFPAVICYWNMGLTFIHSFIHHLGGVHVGRVITGPLSADLGGCSHSQSYKSIPVKVLWRPWLSNRDASWAPGRSPQASFGGSQSRMSFHGRGSAFWNTPGYEGGSLDSYTTAASITKWRKIMRICDCKWTNSRKLHSSYNVTGLSEERGHRRTQRLRWDVRKISDPA